MSVCIALALVGWSIDNGSSGTVELYAKRPLTPEEKKFVQHATSTPDKDLHRAAKLTSGMSEHDMDTFYDHLNKNTAAKDRKITDKIKNLHKKASTLSAMKDINSYFDHLAVEKKKETKKNLAKETGKGKQALEEVNSYFDSLDEQEKAQNEKDILNLGTGASVAEAAKKRVAALKAAKSRPAAGAKARPVAAAARPQHKKPAVGEDDVAAKNEILSYFDSLDTQEAKQNHEDEERLSAHHKYRKAAAGRTRLDSAASDKDLSDYFSQLSHRVHELDKVDKARLRKDSDPVNEHDGVNAALKRAAVSRLRTRHSRTPRTFH